MFLAESKDPVLSAIVYLASLCNGASTTDGQGFNKHDTEIGRLMAEQIKRGEKLSSVDYKRCERFVKKYRKQLEANSIQEYVQAVECEVTADEPIQFATPVSSNEQGLNEGQKRAFHGVLNWFYNDSDETPRHAAFKGWAGCGKTFTLQRIAKELIVDGKKVLFCAPTHKATQILKKMSVDADINVKCETVHRMAGLKMERDSDGKLKADQYRNDDFTRYDLVVPDESSMLSTELYGYFPKHTEKAKFLFTLDPDQLPPVGEEESGSPTIHIPTQFVLSEVMRFSGQIGEHVTAIRTNINEAEIPFVEEGDDFLRKSSRDWVSAMIVAFKRAQLNDELASNPDGIRILSYTNKRTNLWNQRVRNALYGENPYPYISGERLMAKESISKCANGFWRNGSKYSFMPSSAECTVLSAKPATKSLSIPTVFTKDGKPCLPHGEQYFEFNVWELDLLTDVKDRAVLVVLDESSRGLAEEVLGVWRKAICDIQDRDYRREEWKEFYSKCDALTIYFTGNKVARKLQYAFCLTIHQSQGSTFQKVFADNDVMWCQENKLRNQLLYVQGSRASKQLILSS